MRNPYVVLAALLLPLAGACSDSGNSGGSSPGATTPVAGSTTVGTSANEVRVGIADFKFTPATVNVPVGGSVMWTNNDTQQHTATSAGNFDAGAIQPKTSMTVTFQTAGSFTYICSFHPFMTGTVVVG